MGKKETYSDFCTYIYIIYIYMYIFKFYVYIYIYLILGRMGTDVLKWSSVRGNLSSIVHSRKAMCYYGA